MQLPDTKECWMVTLNGRKFKGPFFGPKGREEANREAEFFQGNSQSINGRQRGGLLKHRDRGQHLEVKRDRESEERWKVRLDDARQGKPQKYYVDHAPGELRINN